MHVLEESPDPVHTAEPLSPAQIGQLRRKATLGAGPALPFATELARRTGVPQGLIACAHGGTSLTAPALCGSLRYTTSVFIPVGVRLEWAAVPGADGYRVYADGIAVDFTDETFLDLPLPLPGVNHPYAVRAEAVAGGLSLDSNVVPLGFGKTRPIHLSDAN